MAGQAPANWLPDPCGRFQYRYWDGQSWTHHVETDGAQFVDPPIMGTPVRQPDQARLPEARVIPDALPSRPRILREEKLVVGQKARVIGTTAVYDILSADGTRIGAARQVRPNVVMRQIGLAPELTYRLEVVDEYGTVLMKITEPPSMMRSTVVVRRANASEIGRISQRTVGAVRKVAFDLRLSGQQVGTLNAENWRALDFAVLDNNGTEMARITKQWQGLAKILTHGDTYVVRILAGMTDEMRLLVLGSALAVDAVVHEGERPSRKQARRLRRRDRRRAR